MLPSFRLQLFANLMTCSSEEHFSLNLKYVMSPFSDRAHYFLTERIVVGRKGRVAWIKYAKRLAPWGAKNFRKRNHNESAYFSCRWVAHAGSSHLGDSLCCPAYGDGSYGALGFQWCAFPYRCFCSSSLIGCSAKESSCLPPGNLAGGDGPWGLY